MIIKAGYVLNRIREHLHEDIDPDSWSIVDGKLYLNLNKDVQKLWSDDMKAYIEKADRNWPSVLRYNQHIIRSNRLLYQ